MKSKSFFLFTAPVCLALLAVSPSHAAVDADSAQALMKANKCTKCHSSTKDKTGPSLKKIATKYKGKADAEDAIIKAMTTKPTVKLDDGTEEEHKAINTTDAAELKNLAQWILSQ
jgi:cytochrome c